MKNGGYIPVDAMGPDLSDADPQDIPGIWDEAEKAMKAGKPIIAENTIYGDAPLSPVPVFGWYIAEDEIVLVGATLHIHIKDDDSVSVLDVVGP